MGLLKGPMGGGLSHERGTPVHVTGLRLRSRGLVCGQDGNFYAEVTRV